MTYKQIEASRELRLWLGQVIVPTIGFGAMIVTNPEVKKAAKKTFENVKGTIKRMKIKEVKKEEES